MWVAGALASAGCGSPASSADAARDLLVERGPEQAPADAKETADRQPADEPADGAPADRGSDGAPPDARDAEVSDAVRVDSADAAADLPGDADVGTEHPSDSRPGEPLACVESWPAAGAPAPSPPLEVTPAVRWSTRIARGVLRPPIAVSAAHVAVTADEFLEVLDHGGKPVRTITTPQRLFLSPPAFDAAGNLYVSDASASRSFDASGVERWSHPFDPPQVAREFFVIGRPLLSPDGVMYTAGLDGKLWGLATGTGAPKIEVVIGLAPGSLTPELLLGAGDSIFLSSYLGSGSFSAHAIKTATGASGGDLVDPSGWPVPNALAGPTIGLVGWGYATGDTSKVEVFDRCGKFRWAVSGDHPRPILVGPRDELLVYDAPPANGPRTFSLRRFTADGVVLAGPVAVSPFAAAILGADETLYLVACSDPPAVIALGSTLQEAWRVPIPGACPSSAALGTDGSLYLSRSVDATANEIVAVQTTSQRPSSSAWPNPGFQSMWLVP